jgi:hypothetical protein
MQKIGVLVIIFILVFGCVNQNQTQIIDNTQNIQQNITQTNQTNISENITCVNQCEGRERPACSGRWESQEIRGECVCQFVCDQLPQETPVSVPQENLSSGQINQTIDQRSVEQIMNDSINRIKSDFYSRYSSGIFSQTTYMVVPDQIDPQNSITFGSYVDLMPQINGAKDSRMIGFANIVFKDNRGLVIKIYNSFLFNESTSTLDSQENYRTSYSNKVLRGCINTKKDLIPKTENRIYSNIIGSCERIIEEN